MGPRANKKARKKKRLTRGRRKKKKTLFFLQQVGAAITPTRVVVGDVGVGYTPHARDGTPGAPQDADLPIDGL